MSERLRELERFADAGDEHAREAYVLEVLRRGEDSIQWIVDRPWVTAYLPGEILDDLTGALALTAGPHVTLGQVSPRYLARQRGENVDENWAPTGEQLAEALAWINDRGAGDLANELVGTMLQDADMGGEEVVVPTGYGDLRLHMNSEGVLEVYCSPVNDPLAGVAVVISLYEEHTQVRLGPGPANDQEVDFLIDAEGIRRQ